MPVPVEACTVMIARPGKVGVYSSGAPCFLNWPVWRLKYQPRGAVIIAYGGYS